MGAWQQSFLQIRDVRGEEELVLPGFSSLGHIVKKKRLEQKASDVSAWDR
jgi:hypothetical protein